MNILASHKCGTLVMQHCCTIGSLQNLDFGLDWTVDWTMDS